MASRLAREMLEARGVEVRLGEAVAHVEPGAVVLKGRDGADGERIAAQTVVWAAGVQGSPVGALLGVPLCKGQRVAVTPTLHLPGNERVFVAGDLALVDGAEDVPQQAQPAQQMGRLAAHNALATLEGQPRAPFRYRDLGSMATIGRNAAVAMFFGKVPLTGLLAWLAWVFVHLMRLVGFRNRALVFVSWVYDYFTYDRSARLLLETPPPQAPRPEAATLAARGADVQSPERRAEAPAHSVV